MTREECFDKLKDTGLFKDKNELNNCLDGVLDIWGSYEAYYYGVHWLCFVRFNDIRSARMEIAKAWLLVNNWIKESGRSSDILSTLSKFESLLCMFDKPDT